MKIRNIFTSASWSPYVVGSLIGLLCWITFIFMEKAPGVSTTFVRFYGFLVGIFSTDHVYMNEYLSKYVEYKPVFEWQFALVVFLFIGAWVAAKLSKVTFTSVPYLWGQNIDFSEKIRNRGAFIGGVLVLVGARMAGGCTMGHGISGALQLATISWIFLGVLFASGIITAHIIYRKK